MDGDRRAIALPCGSEVELVDGGPARWLAPDSGVVAEIAPGEVRLSLPGVLAAPVRIGPARADHPVLGPAQPILVGDRELARVAAVDWRHPSRIPAIDAPGRLPPGLGTALLNVLALGARAAARTLRYVGPYPTAALWASLRECFRPVLLPGEDEASAEARFVDGALERALSGDSREVAVDLAPAPFERVVVAPRVVVHLRDGLERAYVGGQAWGRGGARRLVVDGDAVRAVLWLGDRPWAEVAAFGLDGALRDGPRPLPPVRSAVMGQAFPPPLAAALGELLADGEPPLLAAAMMEALRETPVVWGDPGADAARALGGALVVHAGIWDHLGAAGPGALLGALAAALGPPLKQLAQRRLEAQPPGALAN